MQESGLQQGGTVGEEKLSKLIHEIHRTIHRDGNSENKPDAISTQVCSLTDAAGNNEQNNECCF
jgi:hypothetical protein